MNLDPEAPSGGLQPQVILGPSGPVLRHRRHVQALGLRFIPEWSPDLIDWFEVEAEPATAPLDARTVMVSTPLPAAAAARGFARLRLELLP